MDIDCSLEALFVYVREKLVWIRKEQPVPRVARPAELVAGGVDFSISRELAERGMPVHVNHEHVEGDIVLMEPLNQFVEFLVCV